MIIQDSQHFLFGTKLLQWFDTNQRDLPWKKDKDPYKIWVSEIILQQTRVVQGMPYYLRFIENFPTIHDLAKAPEDSLMQVWQGLGYYSRVRNMHYTAKQIVVENDGIFPDSYDELIKLKGIGPYTAAAICSFAFEQPTPVVDGNVIRIIARIFGIDEPYDSLSGKKVFNEVAGMLIDKQKPAVYNQAIMDFGATNCTPKNPGCSACPMTDICFAYKNDKLSELPVKKKAIIRRNRYFIYLVIRLPGGQLILKKRIQKDIWQGLFEFPQIEVQNFNDKTIQKEINELVLKLGISPEQSFTLRTEYKQVLSHQNIHARFIELSPVSSISKLTYPYYLVDYKNLCNFAYPKLIDWFIGNKLLPLRE